MLGKLAVHTLLVKIIDGYLVGVLLKVNFCLCILLLSLDAIAGDSYGVAS